MADPKLSAHTPAPARRPQLRVSDFVPLIGFVVPTAVIGYAVVIPRAGVAGVNELTIGFATSILAACATYAIGVWRALNRS